MTEQGLLPEDWQEQLLHIARNKSVHSMFDGGSVTSLEEEGTRIEYRLVDGKALNSVPWLWRLYRTSLRELASRVSGYELSTSSDQRSAINLNVQAAETHRYERHVDTNPVTGLLFVTTHTRADGGFLVFETDEIHVSIAPVAGRFLMFDARRCPHYVTPVSDGQIRISVPMNYYREGFEQERASDLDDYLFGKTAQDSDLSTIADPVPMSKPLDHSDSL